MSAVVLVTGANKGLGKEVVRQLGRRGLTMLLGNRDPERGAAAVSELRSEGIDVQPLTSSTTSQPNRMSSIAPT